MILPTGYVLIPCGCFAPACLCNGMTRLHAAISTGLRSLRDPDVLSRVLSPSSIRARPVQAEELRSQFGYCPDALHDQALTKLNKRRLSEVKRQPVRPMTDSTTKLQKRGSHPISPMRMSTSSPLCWIRSSRRIQAWW